MEDVSFYFFSYKNEERKERMLSRFNKLNIPITLVDSVYSSDSRIDQSLSEDIKRIYSIMFNHLDMIDEFLKTNKKYGIFCEDDIYISKSLKSDLPFIFDQFEKLKIDVLLLGYLINFNFRELVHKHHEIFPESLTFHKYNDDLWGSQMYLMNRKHAQFLINKYNSDFPKNNKTPFSVDWTLTKDGNRALVFPMYAVEEGIVKTDHSGQINFHKQCLEFNYNPEKYI